MWMQLRERKGSTMAVGDGFLRNQAAAALGVSWGGLYNDGVGMRDDRLMRLMRTEEQPWFSPSAEGGLDVETSGN